MQREYKIVNLLGLHLAPSKRIVKLAQTYECDIYLVKGTKRANAKKLIELLTLGVKRDETVTLITEGAQAAEAQQAVGELLRHEETVGIRNP